jgi:hypothetical protein
LSLWIVGAGDGLPPEPPASCANAIAGKMSITTANDKRSRESLLVNLVAIFSFSLLSGFAHLPLVSIKVSLSLRS